MILKEEEILSLLKPIIEKFKTVDGKLLHGQECEMPEFYPGYNLAIKYAERIRIHAEITPFPKELFRAPAPNQTDLEFQYMEQNYKQNTTPVYKDFHSTISRCMNDGNWSIDYKGDADEFVTTGETLQYYLENKINVFESIENYFKSLIIHLRNVDANGAIAAKPEEFPLLKNEDGTLKATEAGYVIDDSKLIDPQPFFYSCKQTLSSPKLDNKYFIFWSAEKSLVDMGGSKELKGHIFEIYDSENIWRIEQVKKFSDYKFEVSLYFNHAWGKVPAKRLGGIPQLTTDNTIIWQSSFLYACDLLDLVLTNGNFLECSDKNVMFPYRVMLGNKCEYKEKDENGDIQSCMGSGEIYDSVRGKTKDCPHCKGSGLKDRISRTGVMLINPADMLTDGEIKYSANAMYYVSPGTDPSKYVLEKMSIYEDKARKILHLNTSNSVIKGTENLTATGQMLDEQGKFAFVKNNSSQIFNRLEFIIDAIGWMRYREKYRKPAIAEPVTFEFKTEEDYLRQISEAQKSGLPPFVIHSIIFKYLQTLYYNEQQTAKAFYLIVNSDRFLPISNTDLFVKFSRGLAEKWEVMLHDSAISFVTELVLEDENFFEKPFEDQKTALIDKAKEKAGLVADVEPMKIVA